MKKNQQSGFTLIELVMVIVILGILAAVAVPKFIDIRNDAAQTAVRGVASSLGAASAMNKSARLMAGALGAATSSTQWAAMTDCANFSSLIEGWGTGFTIATSTLTLLQNALNTGSNVCTVSGPAPQTMTATFIGYGISG